MQRLQAWLVSALTLLCVAGCGKPPKALPPGLDPIDPENKAAYPAAKDGDPYPEEFGTASGSTDEYDWGHMRGYVHASPKAVWDALKDPQVVADRRNADRIESTPNIEPTYPFSYQLHYFTFIDWQENWRFGFVEGDDAHPGIVVNVNQIITQTPFIEVEVGSMRMERINDAVTAIEFEQHLRSAGSDQASIKKYLGDLFNSVTARVHGQSLPTYK